jgi:hypothetical protein
MEYTIYHIPEKQKIGLTYRNPKIRVREQGYRDFEIIEVHTDYNLARDRELHLQEQYGYKKDNSKYDLDRLSANGKLTGAINGKLNKGKKRIYKFPIISKPKVQYQPNRSNYRKKFNEIEIREIRNSKLSQTELARLFNTTQVTIHSIKKFKTYTSIN